MSDTTDGDGKGKRGSDGERRPGRGAPRGRKPSSAASGRRSGDGKAGGAERSDSGPRSFKPRKPAAARAGGEGDGEGARGKAPFKPRSRGMLSHGGAAPEGSGKPPRSYGRIRPDGGERSGESKRPRSFDTEPRGDWDGQRRPRAAGGRQERDPQSRTPRAPREEGTGGSAVEPMRIAKRLARAGIASRRDAEGMIADGRVSLNGKVLDTPAIDVSPADRIEVDGAPLPAIERTRLWLFHKPAGTVTTNRDPEGRATVFDRLPEDMPRVLSVGRLDINTEGLLLLTNDGGLARVLELPSTGWLRRYRVRAHGAIDQAKLDELRNGIAIDGIFYGAIEAVLDRTQGANVWLTIGLREGKNREVKRVLGHLGLDVNRLIRMSFGPFQLGDLPEGSVREIKGRTLRDQLGERLIEEAGADFEAPVARAFSNKPVAARSDEPGPARPKKRGDWISASDAKPNRKKFGEAKRADALARLDTKPHRGEEERGRPQRFERGDRPERPAGDRPSRGKRMGEDAEGKATAAPRPKPGRRNANVWMAPGARPLGEKKQAEKDERARQVAKRGKDRPHPFGKRREGGDAAARPPRPSSPRPSGPRAPGRPRREDD
ncbi:pseudouridine synthase [Aurantimonas sp. MSK8Z-1]|uniref:pseudouridine synthase n=1 Tax=Mangrovibrevibacter kandeliae TaxID=2968473 RepID=UPI00211889D2|nr:pseudouridine synthase [Aurantimonas sp. MSK8Z-1]MCW4115287.1 pseudouridine synthase [Aurantimonas sp. MSK8Z-1]